MEISKAVAYTHLDGYKRQIKETSIVGYVGMSDLTRVANQMTSKLFDVFTPLLGIAFIYFVLTKVLSCLLYTSRCV